MSTSAITTCDFCGNTSTEPDGWGQLVESPRSGARSKKSDICIRCIWWLRDRTKAA